MTRATLTAGTLILNKDGKPIVTTPEAIGINTELNLANAQVEKPKNIQSMLTEQKATAEAMSDMANAASVYARQKYQEMGDERWKDGGSHKRKLDAMVTALGTALGGGGFGEVATAAISPELNAKIHELTKDNKTTNLLAHAALSALEAKATGHSATAGAAAGLIGEGSAMLLSETVLKKPTELLTAEERSLLKTVGLVSGAAAGTLAGGTTADTVFGAETGKRAVENNYLNNLEVENLVRELAQAEKEDKDPKAIFKKYQQISEANRQAMLDECGNNPSCYLKHIYQMGTGSKEADDNISASGVTSYTKPSGKLTGEMVNFVERENGKSYAVLPNSVHYAGLAIEGAAAAGLGGLGIKDIKGYLAKQSVVTPPKGYDKQDAKLRVSTGAENAANYPRLKEQLRQENLDYLAQNEPKLGEVIHKLGTGKDYGISGTSTIDESNRLGKLWVGNGYSISYEKNKLGEYVPVGLNSDDGLRGYRFPSEKPNSRFAITGVQSNFETYRINPIDQKRVKIGNAHLNVEVE